MKSRFKMNTDDLNDAEKALAASYFAADQKPTGRLKVSFRQFIRSIVIELTALCILVCGVWYFLFQRMSALKPDDMGCYKSGCGSVSAGVGGVFLVLVVITLAFIRRKWRLHKDIANMESRYKS